jgi:uncharacterized Zn ribbon protein
MKTISIKWSTDDILMTAQDMEINLTNDEADTILDNLAENHDAELGICWAVIENYIQQYVEEKKESLIKQIFNDVDGNELKIGDKVVCVDVDDLDHDDEYKLIRGDVLEVTKLIDLETDYIEFKTNLNFFYCFYGHRVLKLKL